MNHDRDFSVRWFENHWPPTTTFHLSFSFFLHGFFPQENGNRWLRAVLGAKVWGKTFRELYRELSANFRELFFRELSQFEAVSPRLSISDEKSDL
jgi:hypothetical protein